MSTCQQQQQTPNMDEEWKLFMVSSSRNIYEDGGVEEEERDLLEEKQEKEDKIHREKIFNKEEMPPCSPISISTKTKISYLNVPCDLHALFWKIPVLEYSERKNGVIKKQMKFNSFAMEEVEFIENQLRKELYYDNYIMTHINNPNGKIKFKDVRKISVGLSKKDLLMANPKPKSAFYNCIVLIFRIYIIDVFKEFHVKLFNTGKIEVPGVQTELHFEKVLDLLILWIQPFFETPLSYLTENTETILINSNFNCGFFIHRDVFYQLLQTKYKISCVYDPCSYPGIQCKLFYHPEKGICSSSDVENQKHLEISFMVFRTGSVLVVGKCNDNVLMEVYDYIRYLMKEEYPQICQSVHPPVSLETPVKEKKQRPLRTFCVKNESR
jgi:hypothetical protein